MYDRHTVHHALDTYIYVLLSILVRSAMNLTHGGFPTKFLMSTERGFKKSRAHSAGCSGIEPASAFDVLQKFRDKTEGLVEPDCRRQE